MIGFLCLPLIAKWYSPQEFGQLQLFQIIVGFLLVVVTLRYETALLQAKDGNEFISMVALCLVLCFASSAFIALVSLFAIVCRLVEDDHRLIAWMLPAGVLTGGLYQMSSYIQLRQQSFGAMSASKIAQASSYVGFASAFARFGIERTGLILSDTISKMIALISWIGLEKKNICNGDFLSFSRKEILQTAYRYRSCPLVTATGGLINSAGGCVTGALMYTAFGASDSGQFGLVERCITLPIGVLGGALSQVYMSKLSKDIRDNANNVLRYFRLLVSYSFIAALLPSVALFFWAPYLFDLFFGAKWKIAGEYAQIMSPLFLVQFVVCPINMSLLLIGKRSPQFFWEVCRLAVLIVGWFTLWRGGFSSHLAVTFHVIANVVMNLIFVLIADRALQQKFSLDSSYGRLNQELQHDAIS